MLEAARSWAAADWSAVDDAEACSAALEVAAARRLLDAALLGITARLEQTDATRAAGWASTKDFLTHLTGGHRGTGAGWVRTARQVAELPEVGAALGEGRLSFAQAAAMGTAVSTLPRDAGLREQVAHELLVLADQGAGASELRHAVGDAVRAVDPDGAALAHELDRDRTERAVHHGRYLTFAEDALGGVRVRGYGTIEDAERLRTVLHSLAAPVVTEPGACGGVALDPTSDPSERLGARRRSCPDPYCDHTGRDPREPGARMWDAWVELCESARETDRLPRDHGARPRVTVTIDERDLRERLGAAHLLDGTPLSSATVRRLACDAEILPAALGAAGQVLDVGRASRLVTPAPWQALVVRDRHCAFPGCTRMPHACDAHHVQHWADGGSTTLPNLVMLCRRHHRLTHHSPWRVSIDPASGLPTWSPPLRMTVSADGLTPRPARWSRPPPRAA